MSNTRSFETIQQILQQQQEQQQQLMNMMEQQQQQQQQSMNMVVSTMQNQSAIQEETRRDMISFMEQTKKNHVDDMKALAEQLSRSPFQVSRSPVPEHSVMPSAMSSNSTFNALRIPN